MLEDKLGEIAIHLQTKKRMKKVGGREVGQCLNDNCFLGFKVDIALTGSPNGCQAARDALNISTSITQNKK